MTKRTRMISTVVILMFIAIAALLYFQSNKEQEFGGFEEGTEQYGNPP